MAALPLPPLAGHEPAALRQERWRPLRLFNLYRFALAIACILLYHLPDLPTPLGRASPRLFYIAALLLLGNAIVNELLISRRRPDFQLQLHMQAGIDIVLITLLMHSSGGIGSGIEMLLLVSVSIHSMLTSRRSTALLAALASLAVLFERGYTILAHPDASFRFPQAGLLGITLFVTALLVHYLSTRARESEQLAHQRGIDLANMAQLTEYVLQQMGTGLLVIDTECRIHLINPSAQRLLGSSGRPVALADIAPDLCDQLLTWQQNSFFRPRLLEVAGVAREILPRFKAIGGGAGTLIFLEDASLANRQAQQLKLASLGRLAAGIAHEVRNPLGAISHAGALLAESPQLDRQERRLTEIILEQSQRINGIIDTINQLGRRESTHPISFALQPWLERLITEIRERQALPAGAIQLAVTPADATLTFDQDHLYQILWNLCQNGLRYATPEGDSERLRLESGVDERGQRFLDLIDSGPGIAAGELDKLFEPFYTTESKGTGLGLYICRELASANRAQLFYRRTDSGESRFRLLFADAPETTETPPLHEEPSPP